MRRVSGTVTAVTTACSAAQSPVVPRTVAQAAAMGAHGISASRESPREPFEQMYAVGVGQFGSPTPSAHLLGPQLTPTAYAASADLVAWASANGGGGGGHQFGSGQWVGADTVGGGNCDEVEVCFRTDSPLVAPPPHVSVPLAASEGAVYSSSSAVL